MSAVEDTRTRLVRLVWTIIRHIDNESVRRIPSAARAIAAGASPDDVVAAMTLASYDTAFELLFQLSAEHAEEDDHEATVGWTLAEAHLLDGDVVPTGSHVLDCLHEDLLSADPSGREGRDLFG